MIVVVFLPGFTSKEIHSGRPAKVEYVAPLVEPTPVSLSIDGSSVP